MPDMARLSHHPEGPGDPPPRRKGRPSRSSQTPSSSMTNGSTKRAASPTPPSVGNNVQPKRQKRTFVDDQEQLTQEINASEARSQATESVVVEKRTVVETETVVVENDPARRRPRYSDPGPVPDEENDYDELQSPLPPSTQALPGLTPHLNRIGRPTKAARLARMSMPAHIETEETTEAHEVQFTPLRTLLDGRVKRRLRRNHLSEEVNVIEENNKQDNRDRKELLELRSQVIKLREQIRDLELQKEASRQGEIEIDEDQVDSELAQANHDLAELKASSIYAASTADDDEDVEMDARDCLDEGEMDMLIPEDVRPTEGELHVSQQLSQQMSVGQPYNGLYPTLPNSQRTIDDAVSASQWAINDSIGESSVQTNLSDRISDKAVHRFETQIDKLVHELASAHSAIRIISIELQNLAVVEDGSTTEEILAALRHTFEDAREEYDKLFGPKSAEDFNNSELVSKLVEHVRVFMTELKEKALLAAKYTKMEKLVQREFSRLLDITADSELRNQDLQKKLHSVDMQTDEQQRTIVELEEDLENAHKESVQFKTEIKQKDTELNSLKREREDDHISLDRLKGALAKYDQDVKTLTAQIMSLEQDHARRVAELQEQHTKEVTELQTNLDQEQEGRATAEASLKEKTQAVAELERRVDQADVGMVAVQEQISRLREIIDTEKEQREKVQMERDSHAVTIIEMDGRLKEVDEQTKNLRQELHDQRSHLAAERAQREKTESELDKRNEEIASLEGQLHDAGVQANELRSKLFQVQQEREHAIKLLKHDFEETEAELTESLEAETRLRQTAEASIDELEAKIEGLQKDLQEADDIQKELEEERDALVAERDERIAQLESTLEDLEQKHSKLSQSSSMQITTLEATIHELNDKLKARSAKIEELEKTAVTAAASYETELEERDATINHLQRELKSSSETNEQLEAKVLSLEGRVDHEAGELLSVINSHADEVEALRTTIRTQTSTISNLQANAEQRASEYAATLAEKNVQLEELQIVANTRAADITALVNQIEEIKAQFRTQEQETRTTIEALQESQRQMVAQNEQLSAALLKKNRKILKAVEEMKVKGLEVHTNGVQLNKVSQGRVTKMNDRVKITKKGNTKRKRLFDSGIGVADDEEEEEMNGQMEENLVSV